jgi:hypothetical protein
MNQNNNNMENQLTIEFFGTQVPAFSTLEAAWNNASPRSEFGTGEWLTNGELWIVMSENHPLFIQILNAKIGWFIR